MRPGSYLSQIVVAPSAYNLVDLTSLKIRLGVTGTLNDAYLNLAIADASAAAIRFMNNPILPETRLDRVTPWRDGWLGALRDRRDALQLKRWPLIATPSPAGIAPPAPPVLAAVASAGQPQTTWSVQMTYVTPAGETAASLEAMLYCRANTAPQAASPAPDAAGVATGYRVYYSQPGLSYVETTPASGSASAVIGLGSPYALGALPFYQPGLTPLGASYAAQAPSLFVTVIETRTNGPVPLAESVDFVVDPELGRLIRLDSRARPRDWCETPVTVLYQAGYAAVPNDIQDAVSEMVKARWYAQTRDPQIRERNVEGVMQTAYWFGTGPGGDTDMPPSIQAKLERYRVPVIP